MCTFTSWLKILGILVTLALLCQPKEVQAGSTYKTDLTLRDVVYLTEPTKELSVFTGKSNYDAEQESMLSKRELLNKTGHKFPSGWCTAYVAQKTFVPWGGNARDWLANSSKYGFQTGRTPQIGAIAVENVGRYGHVSYVEDIKGDRIIVSEQNYVGFGVVSRRTINVSSKSIKGYILTN